ncbi:TPA: hypothetical protein HA278_04705 [Candidatus Woesearchaeota archaeon]|jgi:hypothetical protein|nr:hypothetical protein [Candidatus Woesearchaeota archaeon]|tara:strand:- start:2256 stop:2600 length:345 start_codon:yes stop_codon:yes gene_type:complete
MERLCDSCNAIDLNGVRTHEMSCKDFEEGTSIKRDSLFEQSVDELDAIDYARFHRKSANLQSDKSVDIRFECETCKKKYKANYIAEWDTFRGKRTALCLKCYGIYEAGDPLNGI